MSKNNHSCTYSVSGTHCRSCEILIEKEISRLPGIKSVSASSAAGVVKINYQSNHLPQTSTLNQLFKDSGYIFSSSNNPTTPVAKANFLFSIIIVAFILLFFYLLEQSGLFASLNVNTNSFLPAFFIFGLLAGLSTCAALVGGLLLSLNHQWLSLHSSSESTLDRLQPTLMFNLGRLFFFTLLGAGLGLFGSIFHLSLTANIIITILVSTLMIVLALQMLGVKALSSFQFSLPKSITKNIADESNFQSKYMPFILGGLTFFLPCGFTLTCQGLALASGDPIQGALIMFFFALGTFIPIFLIGYSSVKSQANRQTSAYFTQIAGILVLAFAVFNIFSQLNVLGLTPSFNLASAKVNNQSVDDNSLAPIVNGKQLLKMDAISTGYTPNYFKIKAGQPVRWEITDKGTSGCTNAVISRSLFDGPISLTLNTTSVKEFVAPTAPGKYRFSCWMGMINGIIEVVN